jgi:hypothetical protein
MFVFYLHMGMGEFHWREEGDLNILIVKFFLSNLILEYFSVSYILFYSGVFY